MEIETLAAQTLDFLSHSDSDSEYIQPLEGMGILRRHAPSDLSPAIYDPVVCLILQGAKETQMGCRSFELSPGMSLLVSHKLPVTSRITEASPSKPYLAMVLALDLALLRSLYEEVSEAVGRSESTGSAAMAMDSAHPRLVDAISRYLALAGEPLDRKVMGPLILREIHYRLLMADYGGMLRELLRHDSHASTVARAIEILRKEYRSAISVPELARRVGMSVSSFHKHFRAITASTPLQYQKELRLHEAHRLLTLAQQSVSTVAFEVGYESPNQFSREYSRMFGASPSAHLRAATA